MLENIKEWHKEAVANRVVSSLKDNGFKAYYTKTREDAVKKVLELIPKGAKVATAGSITIRELELPELLSKKGFSVLIHDAPSSKSTFETRRETLTSDVLLASANAVTIDGKLVNIDGGANRVAAMSFGPKRTIIVVGVNKIVKDLEAAIWRIKNVAAPMNAKRLNKDTPCVTDGLCSECPPEKSICKATLILEGRPSFTDYHVVIVGESLGF